MNQKQSKNLIRSIRSLKLLTRPHRQLQARIVQCFFVVQQNAFRLNSVQLNRKCSSKPNQVLERKFREKVFEGKKCFCRLKFCQKKCIKASFID